MLALTTSMRSLSVRPLSSSSTSTSASTTTTRRPLSLRRYAAQRRTSLAPRAEFRPRGDDGGGDKGDKKEKDEVKTAAADPRSSRRRPAPPTRREVRGADDDGDGEPEEVTLASFYASAGIGLMINASGFAAVYRLSPSLKILAGLIEERQDPAVFAFFAKVGTILASPLDIFLLTVCLLLIEFMKWLNEE